MKCCIDLIKPIGCRQGGQESLCLFNYYFDYVLKVVAYEIDKVFLDGWGIEFEYNIPHMCTNREQRRNGRMRGIEMMRWILYADDMVLFCKTVDEAEQLLTLINDTFKRFGLTISFEKTKTQVFNDEDLAEKSTLFNIGEQVIENVRKFTYLGQVITTEEKGCFTEHRISRTISKFNELRNVLTEINVNLRTRRKLLESCVRSRLTYGTQAWFPNEQQMRKLEICWFQCLRSMVKGGWKRIETSDHSDEVDYTFVYSNQELEKILKTVPLRDFIYSQHLKYIAHVCRAENTAITKKMLFAKPTKRFYRDPWLKAADLLGVSADQAKRLTQSRREFAELVRQRFNLTP